MRFVNFDFKSDFSVNEKKKTYFLSFINPFATQSDNIRLKFHRRSLLSYWSFVRRTNAHDISLHPLQQLILEDIVSLPPYHFAIQVSPLIFTKVYSSVNFKAIFFVWN